MSPKEWKQIRQELINRGFKVSVKGKNKREYIAEKDDILINLLRGGISGTSSNLVIYIFDSKNNQMVYEGENCSYKKILSTMDCILKDIQEEW